LFNKPVNHTAERKSEKRPNERTLGMCPAEYRTGCGKDYLATDRIVLKLMSAVCAKTFSHCPSFYWAA